MDDFIIRPMEAGDVDDVLNIEILSFTLPWSRESFRMEVEENKCACYMVAEGNQGLIGYGGMWFIIDEAHITNVAIHPDYRGRGIGKQIMKSLIKEARKKGIVRMTLEVRFSNAVAQNLYKGLGFKTVGIRKGYYHDNEDAIIMWSEI